MTEQYAPEGSDIPRKWLQCNGRQLRKLAKASLLWLEQNHHQVNALNVFPVPDGDTGTNMLLTMRAAYGRIQDSEERHVGRMAHELAHGALMGARGNSGVILSQIWRGLARSLDGKEVATAEDIADAFVEAADTAYKGVMRPVEGTILTVIREGGEEAQNAITKSRDLRFLLERVLERCQQVLELTPTMLPELEQAGVVDSGGQGLVYILEGMLLYVNGQMREMAEAGEEITATPAQALAAPEGGQLEYPYDVQYILQGERLDVSSVRSAIDAMGDSTLVVGDERTIKVHVHVKDPGQPLSYGSSLGHLTDVVIENMQLQMETIVNAGANDYLFNNGSSPAVDLDAAVDPQQITVVAVAAGPGLAEIFRSLGAAAIVNGGQGQNPSTEEIFQAIEAAPTRRVIVLPNNKNVILAAEAARELSDKEVAVVPTRTAPQGISAMLLLNRDGDLETVSKQMLDACEEIASGELTVASRSVTMDGVAVKAGQIIGLVDGKLCASGQQMDEVLANTLNTMAIEERELVSIYYGEDVTQEDAEQIAGKIQELYPDVEIELLPGGQPHYMYVLGAE
ncbi:MAG TPA: DAK2 domain-containing protein [Candidatus Sulfomarinibacteraceae bacterium]|nr:DAK2 domain-containing protein [Candidatus Sulfomarinibacteraceae bacterium]